MRGEHELEQSHGLLISSPATSSSPDTDDIGPTTRVKAAVARNAGTQPLPTTMWRCAASHLLRRPPSAPLAPLHARPFSLPPPPRRPAQAEAPDLQVTPAEARRLVRLVGVEALKRRLKDGPDEVLGYGELLDACVEAAAARTHAEAEALARAMDDAGVLLLFRDKAYLHPEKDMIKI